jgi:anti-anti-sigma factor
MTTDRRDAAETPREPGTSRLRVYRDGDTHVIELAGELDLAAAVAVEQELGHAELSDAHVIAVDLRELTFVESTGIRLIVDAQQRSCRRSDRLVVIRGTPAIQRLVERCGVSRSVAFADRLVADEVSTRTAKERIGLRRAGAPDAARSATSRRVSQAALATAVRELRTRRRPGIVP